MAEIVMTDYLAMLERSRLFNSREQIDAYLGAWRADVKPENPDDAHAFSEWLIQKEYLTQWQSDNIFAGKYKGFFLGQYKLLRAIGAGGMSSVYLAVHTILERQVAIKVLPKSRVTSDSSYLERFLLEAQAVAALDHPNIVRAYDVDTEGNSIYYLVMEYIDGPDLLSLVKKEGPMDIYRAAKYIRQAATGLHHAHMAGLIHRDMKPANLLVDKDDNVHVLDLGLARFTDEKRTSLTLTYDENVLGTADYLAPEQARNSHNVDARADIYGLGCTLYYLLVGHVPFPDGTLAQRIAAHQKRMPTPIREERPDVPDDLAAICWKMMAKDPNDRQQSAQEVVDDLTCWLLEHGQKVEGFTGSLSSLQRKKDAEHEQKQGELQDDAKKELDALAEIASLANSGKSTEDSFRLSGLELHRASASKDSRPVQGGLFSALGKLRQKMGDNRKLSISSSSVSAQFDEWGSDSKHETGSESSSFDHGSAADVLDFSSFRSHDGSSKSAGSSAEGSSSSKKSELDFSKDLHFNTSSSSFSSSKQGSDVKSGGTSGIKSDSASKHAAASDTNLSGSIKKEEKSTDSTPSFDFLNASSSSQSTTHRKEGSSTNNVLNFSAGESSSASSVSSHSSAARHSSVSHAKNLGSSVMQQRKKSPSKISRTTYGSSVNSAKKGGTPSSTKVNEKVIYGIVALVFFVILLILAFFSF